MHHLGCPMDSPIVRLSGKTFERAFLSAHFSHNLHFLKPAVNTVIRTVHPCASTPLADGWDAFVAGR